MELSEEDSALNIDSFMDNYFQDDNPTASSNKIFSNHKISFGFIEQSTKTFYIIEHIQRAKLKIKRTKFLQLSYIVNKKKFTYTFNLIENYPSLIHFNAKIDREGEFYSHPNEHMIILSFYRPPKCSSNKKEEPSKFLTQNLNLRNNLLVLDCPFRNILIENVDEESLLLLKGKIFFSSINEIYLDRIKFISYMEYDEKILWMVNDINLKANNDFYSVYIKYANISENLQRRKLESVCSIYQNYQKDFKICKYTRNNKNLNNFYILKHVQVTPSTIKIKKEIFHQSSRFLRLYYKDDNFLKVEFKDENDSQLYTNTPNMNRMESIYECVFKQGLNLCGRKYIFFLNPTNSMRANSIWMIEERERDKINYYYNELGLNNLLLDHHLSFSKLIARLSQNFTSTIAYTKPFSSSIIDDIKTKDNSAYNDGCGMISYELMKDSCDTLNNGEFASAIQIRYKGAKGVLVVSPKLSGRQIVLTKSMVKFDINNTEDLEIIRFSKYSPGYLNLQIIILLILNGINKKTIYKYAKKEVSFYRINKEKFANQPKLEQILSEISNQDKLLQEQKDYMTKIARSTFIYNRLSNISKKYRFHMKNCGFFIGVCDFDNILGEKEVFVQIMKPNGKKIIITGDILVTKNPCLSVYDIQKVKGVNHPYFENLFYNIIVFPAKGEIPLPSKITGSDLDGDVYWVCWERNLIHIKKRDYASKCKFLKNEEPQPEESYSTTEDGRKQVDIFIRTETTTYKPKNNSTFFDKCLDLHKFFHKNYKLPEVNKKYLSYINALFKYERYKDLSFNDILEIEKLAFYHSIEVDFQKTGETSNFSNDLYQPTFLKKRELRLKMNFLVKIKEIYNEYKNAECNQNFYEFFTQVVKSNRKEMDHSFLRLYEKQQIVKDMYKTSFIYKIYELVSFISPMYEAFISSIFLMSDEFFYYANLSNRNYILKTINDSEKFQKVFYDIKEMVLYYESEIKYIMIENELLNEIELVYLTDFIEPKISIFKNDIEDYKINLNEQIKYRVSETKNKLNSYARENSIDKEDIEKIIFILIFWVENEKISINGRAIDINEIIRRKKRIKIKEDFIEEIVKEKSVDDMKYFFFDHFKSFSLYNYYCN